ncbi:hypothetical protein EVB41_042 [Rhizobium phage RHph_TM3_14A]|nr:hypothetical protein EVB29_042 [Rhizobium phage RHph_TM27A]QIG66962.1 hypothetical protein EVB30_042 [Rhizobium phage RHph_TM27B]QIG67051.1 hypothetical protein EVB31_041 [Rhizobium phage RHph_TM29]QIG67507.1 hypothetical protein EVB41_042 [Rhizobium phage RHph_TM3_14A]
MTLQEHKARAMLLGYTGVSVACGYYFRATKGVGRERIDLKTFEPLFESEWQRRVRIRNQEDKSERFRPWYPDD